VFHRIGVLERWSDTLRVASPTDGVSDVALRNSRIDRTRRKLVTRQNSRRQIGVYRLRLIFGYPGNMVQEFSLIRWICLPEVFM
jgi:hypothetical protein